MACHAHARLRSDLTVGRVEQVDEGRGDDDAGAEVSSEEVDVDGDAQAGHALGDDGEEGREAGDDHDDEEGRHPGSQLAVVLIVGGVESANDLAWIGGGEVDVAGVELGSAEFIGRGGHAAAAAVVAAGVGRRISWSTRRNLVSSSWIEAVEDGRIVRERRGGS